MNHVYRVVWNHSKHVFEAVSEISKGQGKCVASKSMHYLSQVTKSIRFNRSILSLCILSLFAGQAIADNRVLSDNQEVTLHANESIDSGESWTLNENSIIKINGHQVTVANAGGGIYFKKAGGKIIVGVDGELNNYKFISRDLYVSAAIDNEGTLFNASNGTITDINIDNKKNLKNEGIIRGGNITNTDLVINEQTTARMLRLNGFTNTTPTSKLRNNGEMTLSNNASLENHGTVENYGSIGNDTLVSSKIDNKGIFVNQVTGVVTTSYIDNEGIINNVAGGQIFARVLLKESGSLNNLGLVQGKISLEGNGEFNNQVFGAINGTFKSDQHGAGIVAQDDAIIRNAGLIQLDYSLGSSLAIKEIALQGRSQLDNSGTVELSDHRLKAVFLDVDRDAKVVNQNTGTIEFKNSNGAGASTEYSSIKLRGKLENRGILKMGNDTYIVVGHNDSGNAETPTTAKLQNSGVITLTSGAVVALTGNGAYLEMQSGSALNGGTVEAAYWNKGYSNRHDADVTIKFSGASIFNPDLIRFGIYYGQGGDHWRNTSGILNLDVDAGIEQTITANIETGSTTSNSTTFIQDGQVNKLGAGRLILDGQNTYTHGTNVKAGELDVGGSSGSSASMLGPVAVASGATIGGHGTINGNVNVDAGAHLSAGAGTYNAGTLKINGNLILGAGSQIDYDLSDTANDSVIVSGHLETNGATVNVRDVGDISTGLMREIFNYGSIGSSSLGIGTTPIGSSADNFAITHNAGAKKIYINYSGSPLVGSTVLKFWNPDASPSLMGSGGAGVWSAVGNTWTNQHGTLTPGVLDSTADFAIFAGTGGAVTVDAGGVTAKGLQFLSSGYSLNGGQISLDSGVAGQTYISTGGSASSGHNVTINSVITGANGIHKLDAGTLILTAANTYTGGTTVSGGTLQGNVNSIRGAIDVKQNAAVVFDQDVAGTYNDVISGAGSLTKKGSGDLTLAGANSYTGGTTVDTGKLVGDAASLQGNMLVNAGATLAFNQDNQGTFAGNVGGDGDLIKDGAGTLILTGNNSYTGGTQINAGAVQGSAKSLSGDINLAASTAVTFDQSDAGTFVHNITGLGDVNKTGTGALTLTGNVTTTGTTNVQQGALNVGDISTSGKIDGNVNVASGAVVGGNGEIGGTLNLQNGAGVTIDVNHTLKVNDIAFGGANELKIAGITEINSASPVTKTVLESNTALTGNFDLRGIDGISSSTDYLFAGVEKDASNTRYEVAYGLSWFSDNAAKVTGNFTLPNVTDSFTVGIALTDVSGAIPAVNDANWDGNSLKKMGNGTLILNAANTYTGLTDVQSGKLVLGGSAVDNTAVIAGDVNVHSGAVLGGHGRILGNVNVKSGATVAPGNSIGTLTVNNITFNPGSTYEFEANPNGTADKISATGSAKLNGGIVSVLAGAGSWADSTTYTILDAAGGLTGTFDSVNSNLAFLTPALSYDANNVYLKLDRNDTGFGNVTLFPWVSNTFNQRNTGWGIESTGAAHPVYQQIVGMNAWQALSAYDNLSGEIHGSVKSAMLTNTRYARNAVNQHLAANSTVSDANRAIWVATWGHDGHLKADGNAAKVDNKSFGLMLGADIYASEKTAVGAALGYERSSIKARSSQNSDADVDAVHLMAYTRSAAGPVDIKGSIGYSWLSADTTRTITVPGLYSKNKASYDGGILQAFVEASHTFDLSEKFSVTPYANLAYSYLKTDSYTEKGGLSVLHGNSSSDSATTTTLGARGEWRLGVKGSAYANLGWQHTFGSVSPEAELNFIGGARYKVRGTHMDRNGAVIGFGTNFQLQPNVNIGAGYEGYFGDQSRDHGLNVQMELKF